MVAEAKNHPRDGPLGVTVGITLITVTVVTVGRNIPRDPGLYVEKAM